MIFPCSNCGLCCQNIGKIVELKELDLGNGVCKFFVFETNSCSIYEKRPDICKVDKMYKMQYYKQYSEKEFYELNANACNQMQEKYQFDILYRVKIEGE